GEIGRQLLDDRVVRADDGAGGDEPVRDVEGRRVAEVVRAGLEAETQDGHPPALQYLQLSLQLADDDGALQLVDFDAGPQQVRRVPVVVPGRDERGHVLAKAGPTPAHAGRQERGADAVVRADGGQHLPGVRADQLAQVRDLVRKADLRCQE